MTGLHSRGVALAIVLVLLLGLALLAIAGMGGAIASMAIVGLAEQHAIAFEAAEAAVTRTLHAWPVVATDDSVVSVEVVGDAPAAGASPPEGFSIGDGGHGLELRHYTITAESRAARGAAARVEQGFSILEPAP